MRAGALIAAGCALFVGVPNASAAILTYTYTGTVSSGYDQTGVFGTAGADLTGDTFKVVQTFDTSKYAGKFSDGSIYSNQYGGSSYGAGGATSRISIGGSAPRSIADNYDQTSNTNYAPYGYDYAYNDAYVESYNYTSNGGIYSYNQEYSQFSIETPLLTYDYTTPFSLSSNTASIYGSYYRSNYNYNYYNGDYSFIQTYANLSTTSATMTNSLSAVPLPASLPMFGAALLTLAGCGIGLNRRASSKTKSADAQA